MLRPISKTLQRLRDYGLWRTVRYAAYCLDDARRFERLGIGAAMRATRVYVPQHQSGLPNDEYVPHQPTTSYYAFRTLLDRYVAPTENDVFLDYGSGLGRVLIMAATYPFRRILGVEYSRPLVATAEQIVRPIQHRLACQDIQMVNGDAANYEVPAEVTVIYFYNPFGVRIMRAVCEQIRRSLVERPRKLTIVCFRPQVLEETVAGCGWITKHAEVRFPSISVDPFTIHHSVIREP